MAISVELNVGPQAFAQADGTDIQARAGRTGDQIVSELHGRFFEQCYRGNLFGFGLSNTALVSANAIATGVSSSAQPVIGLYNPLTSPVNLVILQASIVIATVAATAVAPGGFMWVGSAGNSAVSTGSSPTNLKTLLSPGGSYGKAFSVSTALTGLTNSLAVIRGTSICPINAAGAATAVSLMQGVAVENVDGSLIVPPGGVVGIMNQISTTTLSVTTSIMWEEFPL
jgi:hypothetical protein